MAFADEQAGMAAAAQQNFVLGVIRGLDPKGWNKEILSKIRDVTEDQIREVMRDILLPVFEPGRSNVVVTCPVLLKENMEKEFAKMGYQTQVKTLTDFYDDYGLEAPEGEENGVEEESDEDDDDEDMSGEDDDEDGSEEEASDEEMEE